MQDLIIKTISQFIENQFPALYREEGSLLIDFVKAYYEYLENEGMLNREMFTIRDIDTTFAEFIQWFKKKYIEGFPFLFATDERFLIKNVIDYYRSKGSEQSLKLLIKFLFNEEVDVYYPKIDILKPSTSEWKVPEYIELSFSNRTKSFVNKTVVGSVSRAQAFVEGVVTKRIDGKLIDLLYISEVNGDFLTGDIISNDGNLVGAPKMIGSLTNIEVFDPNLVGGYAIGDKLRVVSPDGAGAIARIKKLFSSSDKVDVRLVDGGYGFTLDNKTDVMMSNTVIFCDNAQNKFEDLETITQNVVSIEINSQIEYDVGTEVFGFFSNTVYLGSGVILSSEVTENANTQIIILEIRDGIFENTTNVELVNQNLFIENETIEEESIVNLTLQNTTGFEVGETVIQRKTVGDPGYEAEITVAIGVIDEISAGTIRVVEAFGRFDTAYEINGITSESTTNVVSIEYEFEGTTANVIGVSNTEITVVMNGEDFQIGSKVLGRTTRTTNTIAFFETIKWDYVIVDSELIEVLSFSNLSASGMLIGQNDSSIGIFGNENPYRFVQGVGNFIIGSKSGIEKEITRIGNGQNASFELTDLTDLEQVSFNEDFIGGSNITDVSYLDIKLNGEDSFVGRVANVIISDNTTSGYANGDPVSFSGGGYLDQAPFVEAVGYVETDEFGSITEIVISNRGEGYISEPNVSVSGGSGTIQLTAELEVGYGFPKNPYGGRFSIINEMLTNTISTIGTISSIRFTNPGFGYDANPFPRVINNFIKKSNYSNFYIYYSLNQRMFAVDEVIVGEDGAKGRILEVSSDRLKVKNISYNHQFKIGDNFYGLSSQTSSVIENIETIPNTIMGDNATISTLVILSNGIIAEVDIIDSGIGYANDSIANLIDVDGNIGAKGILRLGKSGKSMGFWLTNTSHLNEKKLHDNFYYQEYSYELIANNSFSRYEEILRNILHVAGSELFGRTQKETEARINLRSASRVSSGIATFTSVELVGDSNIKGIPYMNIMINGKLMSDVGRIATFPGAIRIIEGGSGYLNNSEVIFVGGGMNGGEPEKVAQGFIKTINGAVTELIITDQGEGYWEIPQIQFTSGNDDAVIEIDIEYGYGFPKRPYNNYYDSAQKTFTAAPYKYEEFSNTVVEEE